MSHAIFLYHPPAIGFQRPQPAPGAQVRGTYGDVEAQTIVENCGKHADIAVLGKRAGRDGGVASRLIGKREIIRRQVSHTRPGVCWPGLKAAFQRY